MVRCLIHTHKHTLGEVSRSVIRIPNGNSSPEASSYSTQAHTHTVSVLTKTVHTTFREGKSVIVHPVSHKDISGSQTPQQIYTHMLIKLCYTVMTKILYCILYFLKYIERFEK